MPQQRHQITRRYDKLQRKCYETGECTIYIVEMLYYIKYLNFPCYRNTLVVKYLWDNYYS